MSVPKHVAVLIIAINCILLSAPVGIWITSKNVRGMSVITTLTFLFHRLPIVNLMNLIVNSG